MPKKDSSARPDHVLAFEAGCEKESDNWGALEINSNGNGSVILVRLPAIENSSTAEVLAITDTSIAAA